MARNPRRGPTPAASIDDWLNLVDPDGAFLTPGQLRAAFPHGFDPMPADQRADLRAQVADATTDPASAAALRQWLLATVLEWGDQLAEGQQLPATSLVRAAEHGVHLRPDQALLDVDDANLIRLAVFDWPNGTRLDRRPDVAVAGDTWPASPVQRAETWCRESGVPLALVTDDDQWVLVWAPRGAPAASCRWRISDLADERILQAGFISLLGARRFFAVQTDETLEALFRSAADAEAEITKGLGLSVRRSVELLVAATSRDDVAHDGAVLRGVSATEVYEASVTVLMRLVFLLFAEERRLLPAEDPLWAESYSVLTLRDDLRTSAVRDGEDALERRSTAWHRLLATFRAVHGGVNHDRLTLPAYGGSLFDPDRFPFLEGRRAPDHLVVSGVDLGPAGDAVEGPGRPVAIDDRTVLAILDALLTIEVKSGRTKAAQRVSYKALDVEQIGHCYEGLLDHGASPIDVLALGLVGPDGAEPEVWIEDLETRLALGQDVLCEWLSDKDRCGKSASALASLLAKQPEGIDLARLRVACGHDDGTVARVLPLWGLIRTDLRGLPIVLLPGSQYVTQTSTRRNMGAQYTTKALAEEVVQYALEPLVYVPGPQNEADPEKWQLRTPAQILDLRVCDPAVGSGAILTAAGRYLADRLIEAVAQYGSGEGTFAERLADLAAAPAEEQIVLARREIVDHCLYGVDKNPVAVEMAKLSLWLTTMARERPFTFLDHSIQVGDALLGITDLEQLRWLHLDPSQRKGVGGFETLAVGERIEEATALASRLRELSVVTLRDANEKQRLHDELRSTLADLVVVSDAVVGAALSTAGKGGVSMEDRIGSQLLRVRTALDLGGSDLERSAALAALRGIAAGWLRADLPDAQPAPWERMCLHWPLAFPDVFLADGRCGFDGVVANPPFLGGKRISGANGIAYREYLANVVAAGTSGSADLAAYFLLRMCEVASSVGTLATNTISQGDTREVGLDRLLAGGWTIHRALKSEPWPNEANLEIAKIWLTAKQWQGTRTLNGIRMTQGVTASLEPASRTVGPPRTLLSNTGQSFIGSYVNGIGFVLDPEEARYLIETDQRNAQVVMPYLSGADLNDDPQQRPSRWVINFFDWPIERAQQYPACFEIVERLVHPERSRVNRKAHRERWWIYGDKRPALYAAMSSLERVLAITLVSKLALPAWVPTGQVIAHKCVVFPVEDDAVFGLLTSSFHWWWTVRWSSSLGGVGNINYSPSDVFETLPKPSSDSPAWAGVSDAGRDLDKYRAALMVQSRLGLTKTYNRVHSPVELDAEIAELRDLHVRLDRAVSDAYGWSDLDLDHHHWETPQGVRFTVSPAAKDELLDRLLELNHQRHAEEVAAGLHDKKSKKAPAKRAKAVDENQESML
jgi:hypothetical protein